MCICRPWCVCVPQSNLTLQAHRWYQAEYSPPMASWPCYLKQSKERGRGWRCSSRDRVCYHHSAQARDSLVEFSDSVRMRQFWLFSRTSWSPSQNVLYTVFVWMSCLSSRADCSKKHFTFAVAIACQSITLKVCVIHPSIIYPSIWQRSIVNDEVITENGYCRFHMCNKNCS